jgi:hypothetical protein
MDAAYLRFVKNAMTELEALWEVCDTPEELFRKLSWTNRANDKYGNRKWIAYEFGEDELRISVHLTSKGDLTVDYREFYTRH